MVGEGIKTTPVIHMPMLFHLVTRQPEDSKQSPELRTDRRVNIGIFDDITSNIERLSKIPEMYNPRIRIQYPKSGEYIVKIWYHKFHFKNEK
jgi:hypothetical protein